MESLPGKGTLVEVHHDVANRLEVVSAGLLDPEMSVNRSVAGSAGQGFAISIRDMAAIFWVTEALCQSKIYHINSVFFFPQSDQKIVRFDISVEKMPVVYEFNSLEHLIHEHQNSL